MGVSEIPKGISAASFSSIWYLMQKKMEHEMNWEDYGVTYTHKFAILIIMPVFCNIILIIFFDIHTH